MYLPPLPLQEVTSRSVEQQKTPQPVVAKLIATPDAVSRLSPALADAILPFVNKFPDACFGLRLPFAPMHAFAKATASKRAKPHEHRRASSFYQIPRRQSSARTAAKRRASDTIAVPRRAANGKRVTMNNGGDDDDRTRIERTG